MIRCKKCKKFAKALSIEYNKWTEQVKNLKVACKKCGVVDGDYDDYEELPFDFNSQEGNN